MRGEGTILVFPFVQSLFGEGQHCLYRWGEAPAEPIPSSAGALLLALRLEPSAGSFHPAPRLN